jgi:hypothetical protein
MVLLSQSGLGLAGLWCKARQKKGVEYTGTPDAVKAMTGNT